MPETKTPLVYDEPTVMWRMRRADGQTSHVMIGPHSKGAVVVWLVNGRPLGHRDFGEWTSAIRWSEQLQRQNWAAGWRLVPE